MKQKYQIVLENSKIKESGGELTPPDSIYINNSVIKRYYYSVDSIKKYQDPLLKSLHHQIFV